MSTWRAVEAARSAVFLNSFTAPSWASLCHTAPITIPKVHGKDNVPRTSSANVVLQFRTVVGFTVGGGHSAPPALLNSLTWMTPYQHLVLHSTRTALRLSEHALFVHAQNSATAEANLLVHRSTSPPGRTTVCHFGVLECWVLCLDTTTKVRPPRGSPEPTYGNPYIINLEGGTLSSARHSGGGEVAQSAPFFCSRNDDREEPRAASHHSNIW